ncbi:MAG: hypothetical protein J7L55_00785 [Desulfurococcales archaeon]|nr:hypothetical protein [Desulfurococcales archaeon]
MVKHSRKFKPRKAGRRSLGNIVAFAALGIVLVGALYWYFSTSRTGTVNTSVVNTKPEALIADSLSLDFPDPDLVQRLRDVLQKAGYEVTVVYGEDVNLTLYSDLTKYSLIILRVHGGKATYKTPDGKVHKLNGLFTGLPWSDEYEYLKLNWIATRARPYNSNKTFLAVLPKFFDTELKGHFKPGSVLIVASCYSLYTSDIAEALGRKGLTHFIGWAGPVTVTHMDKALELLIDKVMQGNESWIQAVKAVNQELGPDPSYGDYLRVVTFIRKS